MDAIRVEGLQKFFGPVRALDGLDLIRPSAFLPAWHMLPEAVPG